MELGFQQLSTNTVREKLVRDMLQRAHTAGVNPARIAQIEAAWLKRFDLPFVKYKPTSSYLRGFPGHGKTTAYLSAAREVAKMLGMNLIEQPESPQPVGENDLLLYVINLSGEVSNLAVSGVPKIVEDNGVHYTQRMPPFALATARKAGIAVVVLDDMPNASPNIQNISNDLMDRGRAQGLDLGPRALVGATGNLGSEDGTHVSSTSTATATRNNNYMVEDNVEDWCARTIHEHKDSAADAGIVAFLSRHPDMFHMPTKRKKGEPYPTPRSWSRALEEHFRPLYHYVSHGATQGKSSGWRDDLVNRTCELAAGLLGLEVADKVAGYYRQMFNHSLPLAKEVIETGTLSAASQKRFAANYGDGVSAESAQFFMQFQTSLVDQVAAPMLAAFTKKDGKGFTTHVQHLLNGLYNYGNNHANHGWIAEYLTGRVVSIANDPSVGAIDPKTSVSRLSTHFLDQLTKATNGHAMACATTPGGATLFEETLLSNLIGIENEFPTVAGAPLPDLVPEPEPETKKTVGASPRRL
ncbi:MAG: hypothetical protein CVV05_01135 [Gammaproteobacteria bacterium HGW-Gammaproteobacteria-1]|jgi:hypothetical protein|nr:MAG: hypothetical protein CVV05_01135 [Gammaproteobacteria bacterium HGW-Gammaproteobacteria-1]